MKRVITSLILVSLLVAPIIVLAQVDAEGRPEPPGWGDVEIMETLDSIVDWLFAILMIIAAAWLIIAGYYFVTAAGDPDRTKKARDFVLYALVGVLVGFMARGLVMLVARIVGVE